MKWSHAFVGTFALACSLLAIPSAHATELIDPTTKVGITAPNDWTAEIGDVLTLSAPDESTHMIMISVEAADASKAMEQMVTEMSEVIANAKVEGEVVEAEVNGLPCAHFSGTGEVDGVAVHFAMAIVDAGENCLLIIAFGSDEGLAKYSEATAGIFASIHKSE